MTDTFFLENRSWVCRISPAFGANILSLRHNGFPILREPEDRRALRAEPVLYGTPLLLPPNRTAGGRFSFAGRTYRLPINEPLRGNHLHGLLHSARFTVLSHSRCTLQTRLENRGSFFPFPFQIDISDTLEAEGLHRTLRITNTGSTAMPLTLGFHTTFTEPEWFRVPIGKRWITDASYIPTGELAELNEDQRTWRSFGTSRGQAVSGFYQAEGTTAHLGPYAFTVEGFDQWVLYNGGGDQGFLCIEPQLGPVNALGSGRCSRLEAGESRSFSFHITHP